MGIAAALVIALGGWWSSSILPDSYSAATMGYVDLGGGPGDIATHGHGSLAAVSVADLVADPNRSPDVTVDLTARRARLTVGAGREIDGYTLNGTSPGPEIRAVVGDMVQVTLHNEDVSRGVTLHWHGVDVPNAEDGVAGITQDAIGIGDTFTYRFIADAPGTYWYHSHQMSDEQVVRGLLGALVIEPAAAQPSRGADVTALVHHYGGVATVNGAEAELHVDAAPSESVRLRVINTDNVTLFAWVPEAAFTVVAVDGTDLNGATPVSGRKVRIAAGGRADLEVTRPADGSSLRVHLGGAHGVILGPGDPEPTPVPAEEVDLLAYGVAAPAPFDVDEPDRSFDYVIGRRWGFLDGRPGVWWTINGGMYPHVPMFTVEEGDVVVMNIVNHSGAVHPMHLHGHHALVLSRNGVAATGSPWWIDSLDVENGQEYEIAFLADNPGIWMDHCHNLPHAHAGLVTHLMYTGVTTPYVIGGDMRNEPE